jgi:hypothetical protein
MTFFLAILLSVFFFNVSANINWRIYPITKGELYRMYVGATTKFNVSSTYKRDLLYMWENVVRSAINGMQQYETILSYPLLLEDRIFLQQFYAYFPDCRVVIGSTDPHEKNPHLVKIRLEW